jgi:hypothetical protein
MGYLIVLLIFYVFFKELEQHGHDSRFPESFGSWWNNDTAWKNKHKWKPSFLFKTALVWTTDAEHFFQMLSNWCVAGAVSIAAGSLIVLPVSIVVIWVASWLMNEKVLELDELNDE